MGSALGFYRRAPHGGAAASRPALPAVLFGGQGGAELQLGLEEGRPEVVLELLGATLGRSIVLQRSTTDTATAAHELMHMLMRHTAETDYARSLQTLCLLVRTALYPTLRPLLRRATSALVGRFLPVEAPGSRGPQGMLLGMLGDSCIDAASAICVGVWEQLPGAALFEQAQQDYSLPCWLVHEMEAERGALLLAARSVGKRRGRQHQPIACKHLAVAMARAI